MSNVQALVACVNQIDDFYREMNLQTRAYCDWD